MSSDPKTEWQHLSEAELEAQYGHLSNKDFCPKCDREVVAGEAFQFEQWGCYIKKWKKGIPVMQALRHKIHQECLGGTDGSSSRS